METKQEMTGNAVLENSIERLEIRLSEEGLSVHDLIEKWEGSDVAEKTRLNRFGSTYLLSYLCSTYQGSPQRTVQIR